MVLKKDDTKEYAMFNKFHQEVKWINEDEMMAHKEFQDLLGIDDLKYEKWKIWGKSAPTHILSHKLDDNIIRYFFNNI